MKVIFLDHDGVICLADNWGSRFKKNTVFDDFDPPAINVLNSIIEETDAEIVVSSDWRRYCNLEEMGEYYQSQGVLKKPIGMTEMFKVSMSQLHRTRASEIQKYLDEHIFPYGKIRQEITHWVAVDDLDMSELLPNFVLVTNSFEGIAEEGIKSEIIKYL